MNEWLRLQNDPAHQRDQMLRRLANMMRRELLVSRPYGRPTNREWEHAANHAANAEAIKQALSELDPSGEILAEYAAAAE